MFDKEYIRDQMQKIRFNKMMTLEAVAKEIGISYGTLMRFIDDSNPHNCTFKTAKLILNFIEKHKEVHGMD